MRPTPSLLAVASTFAALVACRDPSPTYPAAGAPAEIVAACALTEHKCTGCHDRERYQMRVHTPDRWAQIVHKMRLLPASSITPNDAEIILRCLNYHSSTTSMDMYVTPRGEVQALHFDLHNVLHETPKSVGLAMCNPLE